MTGHVWDDPAYDGCRCGIRLKIRDGIRLVVVKDPAGKLIQFYAGHGPTVLPEWALHDPKQVSHLVNMKLVEFCTPGGVAVDPDRVTECVAALVTAGFPRGSGAPRARAALAGAGFRFANETIHQAVKIFNGEAKDGNLELLACDGTCRRPGYRVPDYSGGHSGGYDSLSHVLDGIGR